MRRTSGRRRFPVQIPAHGLPWSGLTRSIRVRTGTPWPPASSSASTWAPPTGPSPTWTPAPGDDAEGHAVPDPAGRRPRRGRGPAAAAVVPVPARRRRAAGRRLKLPWDANRDYSVGEFARAFGSQVPTRLVARRSRGCATPASTARPPILPCRRRGDRPQGLAARGATLLPEAPRRGVEPRRWRRTWPTHRLEVQDIVLTVPGVVRRRGPRADRRGRPRRRARAPHAARGAAGGVLRLARPPRRRAGASRSRSATWCWSPTSAAAPPTSR